MSDNRFEPFLKERDEYLERQQFHPDVWMWFKDFEAVPHEFPPDSIEQFDEVVAWTLANIDRLAAAPPVGEGA